MLITNQENSVDTLRREPGAQDFISTRYKTYPYISKNKGIQDRNQQRCSLTEPRANFEKEWRKDKGSVGPLICEYWSIRHEIKPNMKDCC